MRTWTLISREHSICCGHTVFGHEGKCQHLHGHNYKIDITVQAPALDGVGRVVDFSVIKDQLCTWLENHWDHSFLVWDQDPRASALESIDPGGVLCVPFNPTAENMCTYLVETFQGILDRYAKRNPQYEGLMVRSIRIHETEKCSAFAGVLSG